MLIFHICRIGLQWNQHVNQSYCITVGSVTKCDQLSTCIKWMDIILTNKNRLLNNTNNKHGDNKDSRRKDWSSNKHNLNNEHKHHDLYTVFSNYDRHLRGSCFVMEKCSPKDVFKNDLSSYQKFPSSNRTSKISSALCCNDRYTPEI